MGLFDEWRDRWAEGEPGREETFPESSLGLPSNVFLENEPLIIAMGEFAALGDSNERREELVKSILISTLLIPTPDHDKVGVRRSTESERMAFMMLTDDHGSTALPAFTDEGALAAYFGPGTAYVALSATDLFPLVLENEQDSSMVILNPGTSVELMLTEPWIRGLAVESEGKSETVSADGEEIIVGFPSRPLPEDVKREIASICAIEPLITGVYEFVWFIPNKLERPQLVLAFELDITAAPDNAYRDGLLRRAFAPIEDLTVGFPDEVVAVDLARCRSVFGDLVSERPPLYQRRIAA